MSIENKQKPEKSNSAVIIGLGAALVVGAVVLCIALISVFGDNSPNGKDVSFYSLASAVENSFVETANNGENEFFVNDGNDTTASLNNQNIQGNFDNSVNLNDEPNIETTKNEAVAHYEQFSKNGDNILSDHFENKYIKLVSTNYSVESDLLVAIYSQPDTGNNFVLQFDGTKDSDGNIVKSPDTLKKVYQIDKEGNIKIATGTQTGNVGVSYAEGMLCFNMVKTLVMEQYPDYFTGLDK